MAWYVISVMLAFGRLEFETILSYMATSRSTGAMERYPVIINKRTQKDRNLERRNSYPGSNVTLRNCIMSCQAYVSITKVLGKRE